MDKLIVKFIEEASEHIQIIEQNMLLLEKDPENTGYIEIIFRSMHTLKGAGSMFGFENISEITHDLENVYDEIRAQKRTLSRELFDITLSAVDHIKELIKFGNKIPEEIANNQVFLVQRIRAMISENVHEKNKLFISGESEPKEEALKNAGTYYISFKPFDNIFDNGTNPLYLIDELVNLGSSIVIPYLNNVPDITTIDPFVCYTYWEIFLATESDISIIHDVFLFVEDLCTLDIHKISDNNLLKEKKFVRKIDKLRHTGHDIGINEVQILANEFKDSVSQKVKKAMNSTYAQVSKDYSISSIRVSSEKLDQLMNLVSELVTTQARLNLYAQQNNSNELTTITETTQKLSRQLRDLTFEIALVPIDTLVTRFQRLVRDLSKELGKDVIFETQGTETELDKTIIENLTDPLMHIIRNCLDHGIESSKTRQELGKPEYGKIIMNAFHSSTNVHIEIIDDGAGLNNEKIRRKAINHGLITEDTVLSERQLHDLIFQPGFSTAEIVTDVSGRGVGMDVVKQKIAGIRGQISVESEKNKGTKITLIIPLTLSIIDGLLVKVENTNYIIPLSAIEKIYAIQHQQLKKSFNNQIVLDGKRIPYFSLRHEFQCSEMNADGIEQVILIEYEKQKVGLVVDLVIGEYQAVLKPIGKHYKDQEIISAATILGDGTVALVMDTSKIITHFNAHFLKSEVKI
ncbi:MAG: chemotaxis protein CheA [Bacteroidales bacterium]|nr:chemotaxis protein CheA [Bacteroidales bacterium]